MISQTTLKQIFDYDAVQGVLIWRSADETVLFIGPKHASEKAGKVVGTIAKIKGGDRRQVMYKRKGYMHSRLVWVWHYGQIPDGKLIDHINRNSLDDRIENLRLASKSENCRNNCGRGYFWNTSASKWQVKVGANGKSHSGGYFHSEIEAAKAANLLKKRLHGEFASSHEPAHAPPLSGEPVQAWLGGFSA